MREASDPGQMTWVCFICYKDFCNEHLVIGTFNGNSIGGVLHEEWDRIVQVLQVRVIKARLEDPKKDRGLALTNLFAMLASIYRKETGYKWVSNPLTLAPGQWSKEVHDAYESNEADDLRFRIELIMIEVLGKDGLSVTNSYYFEEEFEGCTTCFEIYALNPEKAARRFRMVLYLI